MKVKKILLILSMLVGGAVLVEGAMGLGYQSGVDVQFTFNPTLSVSVSDAIHLTNLAPGTAGVSDDVVITVTTNSVSGYNLTAAAGGGTYLNTNLVNDLSDAPFTSIAVGSSVEELVTDNTWGYTIDSGETYSGLPYYDAEGVAWALLRNTTNASGSATTNFAIGARAALGQVAGNYLNVIQFKAVTNVMPYMQDLSSSLCTSDANVVYDIRDGEAYTIQRLADGKCWMLENLRLDADSLITTLNHTNTNMSADRPFTLPESSTWTNARYEVALVNTASKATTGAEGWKYGVYYNYCAATAGTYCYDSTHGVDVTNTDIDAPYDICPAGWRMPTGGANGELQSLYSRYSDLAEFQTALKLPLAGSFYTSGANLQDINGFVWSSTYGGTNMMYRANVNDSESTFSNEAYARDGGLTVRCLLKENS